MHRFTQADVFTDELMFGNPVAVVHDADELTTQEMAAFANWTNLSETTFLSAPTDERADYQVRIFTTRLELPFAGHPTLGSAHAWLEAGGTPRNPEMIIQQCGAGLVRVRRDGTRLAFAAPPLIRGGAVEAEDLTEIMTFLRIDQDQVVDAQWADNGPGWVALLLANAETVLELQPNAVDAGRFDAIGVIGPYPPGSETDFEVRAFAPLEGQREDPVTGSLNAALGEWLINTGRASTSYIAAQGTAIGRRGRVFVSKVGNEVWTGGHTVTGVSGTVHI
ncbi:MAG TPA: PhzF family phenazine biosynthesis protein [Propionibacteriaceae bacterium]|nr:PhzF family phenazine biosynthesis protein [Propionibacteriaceae bacterium]